MKRFLLGGTALVAMFAGSAMAADMPVRAPMYKAPPPVMAAVYNWTGSYVGVNGGWGSSANNRVALAGTDTGAGGIFEPLGLPGPNTAPIINRAALKSSGGLGGVQAGYNWQTGTWLFGIEADIDAAGIKGSNTINAGGPGTPFVAVSYPMSSNLKWLGTVRGRLGMLVAPQFLLYGTGGFAFGRNDLSLAAIAPGAAPPCPTVAQSCANTNTNTQTGYVIGGGVEWKFAPNWSVKGEYLFVDLGNQSSTITYNYGTFLSTGRVTAQDRYNIGRAGLNYQF